MPIADRNTGFLRISVIVSMLYSPVPVSHSAKFPKSIAWLE